MLDELCVIEVCKEVVCCYSYGVDWFDGDWMKLVYWFDGIDDYGVFVGNVYEFVDYCMVTYDRWVFILYTITNHFVELDEDGIYVRGEVYNISYF